MTNAEQLQQEFIPILHSSSLPHPPVTQIVCLYDKKD